MTIALLKEATVAVEWTITIQGKNEFGDVCHREVRVDKSWERLFDGEVGLSIEAGKKIMAALQGAVVSHEAETYSLFRRVCQDCHTSGRSRTTRRAGSEPCSARSRCAIPAGSCAGLQKRMPPCASGPSGSASGSTTRLPRKNGAQGL
ncbi:hypothetical protein FHT97_005637, partial [Rhizobium sp. BK399]|nr:hypothetical protein [Rhizobium sp. BK399]